MERNKSLTLMTEIFNKLSNKTFISKTCPEHSASIPMFICENCFKNEKNVYCNQCFEGHKCANKVRGQIPQWVSQQQQSISKKISSVLKQFQSCKQMPQYHRLKLCQNTLQRSILQLNNQISTQISKSLQPIQRIIQQNCIKPTIQGLLKISYDNYITETRLQLSKLTGDYEQISALVGFCERGAVQLTDKIRSEVVRLKQDCRKIYIDNVYHSVRQVLAKIFGEQINLKSNNQKNTNSNIQDALKIKISSLQTQINLHQQKAKDFQSKITQINKNIKEQRQSHKKKLQQIQQINKKTQKQVQIALLKAKQYHQKLINYQKLYSQDNDKNQLIRKLEQKCRIYQQKLSQNARAGVGEEQVPQKRYNMEQIASKLNQLTAKYQSKINECNQKDKSLSTLSTQLNRLRIKIKQSQKVQVNVGCQTAMQTSPTTSQQGSAQRRQFRSP